MEKQLEVMYGIFKSAIEEVLSNTPSSEIRDHIMTPFRDLQ